MTHSSVGEQGHCVARWPWACHAAKPTSASPARTPRAEPASPDYLPLPRRCPEHTTRKIRLVGGGLRGFGHLGRKSAPETKAGGAQRNGTRPPPRPRASLTRPLL